ncbi:lipopolysaccharide biosynthesis protein [Pseudonocardia sp.]|uniref:lipopolysaccharide biosynthesis protein n=1 Tax=Pseudonocardia sp. TaxID=60912 RepID=UPI003D14504F
MTDVDQSAVVPTSALAESEPQIDRAASNGCVVDVAEAEAPHREAWRVQLRNHLADPFFRNAYALIANTGLTALLGLGFWALAARLYDDSDVGRASALISAMTVLSGVVAINLAGTLSRFIPESGRRTGRLIGAAYALSSAAVLVLTLGFLLFLGQWGTSFELLRDPVTAGWFLLAVVAAGIFTVQDGVLVGLRSAVWVPMENVVFGIAKIVLLVVLAASFPGDGVYLAWIVPMMLLILPINALIFGRLVPWHVAASPADQSPPTRRTIGRFFLADYAGSLFMFGAATVPPVLVAPFVEPSTFAYFYIAWITAGALNLLGINLAHSLTVEGVYEARRLVINTRAALRRGALLTVTAAVFLGVAAPTCLELLGSGYVEATSMLQALGIAAIPRMMIEIWVGVLRARSRVREIVRVQVGSGGLAVAAVAVWVYLCVGSGGSDTELITGVGVAVLLSQVAVAAAVAPAFVRFVRDGDGAGAGQATPNGRSEPDPPAAPEDRDAPLTADRPGGGGPAGDPALDDPTLADPAPADAPPWDAAPGDAARGESAPADAPPWDAAPGDAAADEAAPEVAAPEDEASAAAVPTAGEAPPAPAPGRIARLLPWLLGLVGAVAVTLTVRGLAEVRPAAVDGYGLVSGLPVIVLAGLGLLTVTFLATLARRRQNRFLLAALLVATICCLHGATLFASPQPRFNVTWVHLGFVEFISRTGGLAEGLDARFSWPGFFALVAFWLGDRPSSELVPLLGFVPVVSNLLYLLPLALLIRNLRMSWQAAWTSAWLFGVLNWIGQDYFSPQGFTYGLYLVFIAGIVTWLRAPAGTEVPPGRWSTIGRRLGFPPATVAGELPPTPVGPRLRAAILLVLVGVFLVAVAGHQLTPFVMVAACAALVLVGRCAPRSLPVLLAALLATFISYLAVDFWSGHLAKLLGGVGDVGGNLSTSIVERAGAGAEHQHVVLTRVGLALFVAGLAWIGLLRRRRRGIADRVLVVLLVVPLLTVGLQSYGGEIMLRAYLFVLPAAAILAACAFLPAIDGKRPRPLAFIVLGATMLALVGAFLVARFGNEAYERTDPAALEAVEFVYDQPGVVRVVSVTLPATDAPPFLPVGYRDAERTRYTNLPAPEDPSDVSDLVAALRDLGPGAYLVTTAETEAYLRINLGYPPDWGERFARALTARPEIERVAGTDGAAVYRVRGLPPPAPAPAPPVSSVDIGSTPWTGFGLILLAGLTVLVGSREIRRILGRPVGDRTVSWIVGILAVGLLLVIIERLVLLA